MKIIVIILVVLWVYSYFSFKSKYKFMSSMVKALEKNRFAPEGDYLIRLGSAYMNAQQYKSAIACFSKVLNENLYYNSFKYSTEDIKTNIEFCKNPCIGYSGGENLNGSWLHNFILVRFGGRRKIMIEEEDILLTDEYMRNHNI